MNIYAISDLHLASNVNKPMDIFRGWDNHIARIIEDWHGKVASDDIVLLCGDLSWAMRFEDVVDDLALVGSLNGSKIIIKGNHDYWWSSIVALRNNLPSGMYALQNDCLRLGNYVFCGTRGWTNIPKDIEHDSKMYNREIERLKLSLQAMSKMRADGDIVIALAHYPPYSSRLGSTPFTELYAQYGVKKVVYGHLHGKANVDRTIVVDDTEYILTSCDKVEHTLVKIV